MNRKILQLAIPNIISNITIPLLGMVDLAIVGHMGNEIYIGAIAIGTIIFNFLYWNLGFLRMGTSGFTAQAYGRRNMNETIFVLVRSLSVAGILSVILLLLQYPIGLLSFRLIASSNEVAGLAYRYYHILIWAAPAVLAQYAIKGWFIGMQNSKAPMWISVIINLLNIIFSLFFVYVMDMKVEGIALGTLLAQYGGLLSSALFFYYGGYRKLLKKLDTKEIFHLDKMLEFFSVNGNIFLRTVCLVSVFTFFTSASAKMGNTILAVNTLLIQMFTLFSYVMDGFAYAGEALAGKYAGAKNLKLLRQSIRSLMTWGIGLSLLVTIVYFFFGDNLLMMLTSEHEVITTARSYLYWILPIPVIGFSSFLWDGIYIGTSAAKEMRNCMLVAMIAFFAVFYTLEATYGVNALWSAFLTFLALRGILQQIYAKSAIYQPLQNKPASS